MKDEVKSTLAPRQRWLSSVSLGRFPSPVLPITRRAHQVRCYDLALTKIANEIVTRRFTRPRVSIPTR
jgi:hypothetical protein